jgi:hypothetical protein
MIGLNEAGPDGRWAHRWGRVESYRIPSRAASLTRLCARNDVEKDSDPRDGRWRASGPRRKAEGNNAFSLCEFSTLLRLN